MFYCINNTSNNSLTQIKLSAVRIRIREQSKSKTYEKTMMHLFRSINKVILQIIRTLRHQVILGIEKDYLVIPTVSSVLEIRKILIFAVKKKFFFFFFTSYTFYQKSFISRLYILSFNLLMQTFVFSLDNVPVFFYVCHHCIFYSVEV